MCGCESAEIVRASRSKRWRELRVGGDVAGRTLTRDRAIEPRVARLVDLAHPARAERREDLVGTQARAGGESHRFRSAAQFCTRVIGSEPWSAGRRLTQEAFAVGRDVELPPGRRPKVGLEEAFGIPA